MAEEKTVYLDGETSLMPQLVLDAFIQWTNRGSSRAKHASGQEGHELVKKFRKQIASVCEFDLAPIESSIAFKVLFTSGAAESNYTIITRAMDGYWAKTGNRPHIITSNVEHPSVLSCCKRLEAEQSCQLTVLPVGTEGDTFGVVRPLDLELAIKKNTCLVSIIAANHETGIINNLKELSKIARKSKVPFHSDVAQLFGKTAVRPCVLGLDAFSISLHKLHGPPGIGVLVVRNTFVQGYGIKFPEDGSLHGNMENLPGIGAGRVALRIALKDRAEKTVQVIKLRAAIKNVIEARIPCFYLDDHPAIVRWTHEGVWYERDRKGSSEMQDAIVKSEKNSTPIVVWIAPVGHERTMPGTLTLSVRRPHFNAEAARAALERRGILISALTSRCDTVTSLNIPKELKNGILRICISDETTTDDIKAFARNFLEIISGSESLRR